jgi:putative membrane protein
MHGDIGGSVKRGGIAVEAEESDVGGEVEMSGQTLALGAGGTVAGEPELPVGGGRKPGGEVDEFALIFLGAEHRNVEQDRCRRSGTMFGAETLTRRCGRGEILSGEDERVVNNGDLGRRNVVLALEIGASFVAVGDDVTDFFERATEEERQGFARPERAEYWDFGMIDLEGAGEAVGHAAHAEYQVGLDTSHRGPEAGREPIEVKIEGLEGAHIEVVAKMTERAAGPKSEQRGGMAGFAEGACEQDRLSLGAATAEKVLNDENFHCRARVAARKVAAMNSAFLQLLVRWAILALGVTLATKLGIGITCDSGATLLIVVVLLSFFNVILKPLLVLFTLPFILLTLGLGMVVINALLFLLVGRLVDGFHVDGFWSAVGGALVVSVTNIVLNMFMRGTGGPGGGASGGKPAKKEKPTDVIDI